MNSTEDNASEVLVNQTDSSYRAQVWAIRGAVYGIGGTTIASFGLLANIVSIIVLSKFRQTSSAPLLLIVLALFDSLLLTSSLLLDTIPTMAQGKYISYSYVNWVRSGYVLFHPIPQVAKTGTTYMTVLITVERYIAVVKPFLASRLCSKLTALKCCAVVLIWSIVYHIPLYLSYTITNRHHAATNTTRVVLARSEFGESYFYNQIYVVWINFTLHFLFPCTTLVVLNVLLLRTLRKSQRFAACQSRPKSGQKLTAMVVAVTVMFFICELFSATTLIVVRGMDTFVECTFHCTNFVAISDTMSIINSASNFFLYCAVGRKFRNVFMVTFCCYSRRVLSDSKESTRATSATKITCHELHENQSVSPISAKSPF